MYGIIVMIITPVVFGTKSSTNKSDQKRNKDKHTSQDCSGATADVSWDVLSGFRARLRYDIRRLQE